MQGHSGQAPLDTYASGDGFSTHPKSDRQSEHPSRQLTPVCAPNANPRAPGHAFTLIELLVVVAIIAILASLLLPALGKAKNHAGKVTDMDNLRQIMVAVHLYCSDNNDVLPPPNWDNGGSAPTPHGTNTGWLYAVNLNAADNTARFVVQTGLLWNTLHIAKVYFCPMDNPSLPVFSVSDQRVETRPQQISSYAMNGGISGLHGRDLSARETVGDGLGRLRLLGNR